MDYLSKLQQIIESFNKKKTLTEQEEKTLVEIRRLLSSKGMTDDDCKELMPLYDAYVEFAPQYQFIMALRHTIAEDDEKLEQHLAFAYVTNNLLQHKKFFAVKQSISKNLEKYTFLAWHHWLHFLDLKFDKKANISLQKFVKEFLYSLILNCNYFKFDTDLEPMRKMIQFSIEQCEKYRKLYLDIFSKPSSNQDMHYLQIQRDYLFLLARLHYHGYEIPEMYEKGSTEAHKYIFDCTYTHAFHYIYRLIAAGDLSKDHVEMYETRLEEFIKFLEDKEFAKPWYQTNDTIYQEEVAGLIAVLHSINTRLTVTTLIYDQNHKDYLKFLKLSKRIIDLYNHPHSKLKSWLSSCKSDEALYIIQSVENLNHICEQEMHFFQSKEGLDKAAEYIEKFLDRSIWFFTDVLQDLTLSENSFNEQGKNKLDLYDLSISIQNYFDVYKFLTDSLQEGKNNPTLTRKEQLDADIQPMLLGNVSQRQIIQHRFKVFYSLLLAINTQMPLIQKAKPQQIPPLMDAELFTLDTSLMVLNRYKHEKRFTVIANEIFPRLTALLMLEARFSHHISDPQKYKLGMCQEIFERQIVDLLFADYQSESIQKDVFFQVHELFESYIQSYRPEWKESFAPFFKALKEYQIDGRDTIFKSFLASLRNLVDECYTEGEVQISKEDEFLVFLLSEVNEYLKKQTNIPPECILNLKRVQGEIDKIKNIPFSEEKDNILNAGIEYKEDDEGVLDQEDHIEGTDDASDATDTQNSIAHSGTNEQIEKRQDIMHPLKQIQEEEHELPYVHPDTQPGQPQQDEPIIIEEDDTEKRPRLPGNQNAPEIIQEEAIELTPDDIQRIFVPFTPNQEPVPVEEAEDYEGQYILYTKASKTDSNPPEQYPDLPVIPIDTPIIDPTIFFDHNTQPSLPDVPVPETAGALFLTPIKASVSPHQILRNTMAQLPKASEAYRILQALVPKPVIAGKMGGNYVLQKSITSYPPLKPASVGGGTTKAPKVAKGKGKIRVNGGKVSAFIILWDVGAQSLERRINNLGGNGAYVPTFQNIDKFLNYTTQGIDELGGLNPGGHYMPMNEIYSGVSKGVQIYFETTNYILVSGSDGMYHAVNAISQETPIPKEFYPMRAFNSVLGTTIRWLGGDLAREKAEMEAYMKKHPIITVESKLVSMLPAEAKFLYIQYKQESMKTKISCVSGQIETGLLVNQKKNLPLPLLQRKSIQLNLQLRQNRPAAAIRIKPKEIFITNYK